MCIEDQLSYVSSEEGVASAANFAKTIIVQGCIRVPHCPSRHYSSFSYALKEYSTFRHLDQLCLTIYCL